MLTRSLAVAVATGLSFASISAAQSASATISGIITDSTGAVLPGVLVTAIHADTRQRISATSNQRGFYALTLLPVGTYTVEAELAGPARTLQLGLRVVF
jgi:hypothetical protein